MTRKALRRLTAITKSTGSSNASDAEDWTPINDASTTASIRPSALSNDGIVDLLVHPLRESNALIVSVHPPKVPKHGLKRASCDIVLVIDVSGSMADDAPVPGAEDGKPRESTGLSILDLVKHASRTILDTLGQNDRLGIVTFSDDATVSNTFSHSRSVC
jgi:hypothetical protein